MLGIIIQYLSTPKILHADCLISLFTHSISVRTPCYYYSMTSETIDPSTFNLRSKGVIIHAGKLHKGCVKDATSKLSIGSIPSTYESIIYKTDCKKAFGTSEKRFYEKENASSSLQNSNNDDLSTLDSYVSETKINHNRLGQNAFISKEKRQWFRCVKTPGPTHYGSDNDKQENNKPRPRKCFTRQLKKQELSLLREKSEERKETITPGPGEYIQDRKQFWTTTNKGWKSSFETKVDRDGYIPESISPGPGYYQLMAKAKEKSKKHDELKVQKELDQKRLLNQILKEKAQNQLGPCTYNQQIPSFKPLYERIKLSKNFMAPIFVGKKRNKGAPGPTAYPVKRIYEDLKPKLIESTCFMSETMRNPFQINNSIEPSPIEPKLLGHKNFHFNIKNEWMC